MVNKWITDLSLTGYGLRDWLVQRFSSIILGIYFLALSVIFLSNGQMDYHSLRNLFTATWMQIFAFIALISLFIHAWVGVWTVITDYIKPIVLRLTLQVMIILILMIYSFWGVIILWKFA